MKTYSDSELIQGLVDIGIKKNGIILVHASLANLGMMKNVPMSDQCSEIFRCFKSVLGGGGTLVVPTFTFEFAKGNPFDRQKTPSAGMGVFSEYLRSHADAIRSPHPMQSFAAVGAYAKDICARDTESAFSKGGPVHRMIELGAQLVLLGASMQAASLIHFVEESLAVPYRYWKNFSGEYVDEGVVSSRMYKMYVRDEKTNPTLDLKILEKSLLNVGKLNTPHSSKLSIQACSFDDFIAVAQQDMEKDSSVYLKK